MSPLVRAVPRPQWSRSVVVVHPPAGGPGAWAGGPSALLVDGVYYLAYRLRRPVGEGRGFANVVARSADGVEFEPVAVVRRDRFHAESLERPALTVTPEGRWRLYISLATPDTKHWRVAMLEADRPEDLPGAPAVTVLPGDATVGVKDPVLLRDGGLWHLWASVHPLESEEHADRMSTWYATSPDGVDWTWRGSVLNPRPGRWDARGVRLTSVLPVADGLVASYDGRASASENWEERTGTARADRATDGLFGPLSADEAPPTGSPYAPGGLRYLSVLALPAGGYRLYFEATRADGAHELRSELVD